MKPQYFLTLAIFLFSVVSGFSQATYKYNQTFASMNAVKISTDLDSDNIQIKTIKGSRIVVETLVKISSNNDRLLNFIVEGGRYNLDKRFNDETNELTLISKKNKDIITIKGEEISEEFTYVIYIPESTEFVSGTLAVN